MEKQIKQIPTHNNDNERIRVIEVGKMRFYDDDEYYEWNDKYSEPNIRK
jgi:hypothetical protein